MNRFIRPFAYQEKRNEGATDEADNSIDSESQESSGRRNVHECGQCSTYRLAHTQAGRHDRGRRSKSRRNHKQRSITEINRSTNRGKRSHHAYHTEHQLDEPQQHQLDGNTPTTTAPY